MKPISPSLVPLLRMIVGTSPEEIDCDECDRRLSAFAESCARNRIAAPLIARCMREHLANCPDCREELEALIAILSARTAMIH